MSTFRAFLGPCDIVTFSAVSYTALIMFIPLDELPLTSAANLKVEQAVLVRTRALLYWHFYRTYLYARSFALMGVFQPTLVTGVNANL